MNKLPKEQLQKIVMMVIFFIILVFVFLSYLISPIGKQKETIVAGNTALEKQVKGAKQQISTTRNLETQSTAAIDTIDRVNELIPEGAPIAWFPPRIERHFAAHDIPGASPRLVNSSPPAEAALASYNEMEWSLTISKVDFFKFAIALAGLENEHPLLKVTSLRISADAENPAVQNIEMEMKNLVRQ